MFKKKYIINLSVIIAFLCFSLIVCGQTGKNGNFEGTITFVMQTFSDTIHYSYHVKDNMVRFDELDDCSVPHNCLLFNLKERTITAISPMRKLYMDIPLKPYADADTNDFEIIKSLNNKKIQGYKCYQWRVKNKSQNTEIAFWVVDDGFAFFDKLLRLWNRSEKHAQYFLQIPDKEGYMPMLSTERSLLRDKRMKLAVTKIERKTMDPELFKIPEGYQSYDH